MWKLLIFLFSSIFYHIFWGCSYWGFASYSVISSVECWNSRLRLGYAFPYPPSLSLKYSCGLFLKVRFTMFALFIGGSMWKNLVCVRSFFFKYNDMVRRDSVSSNTLFTFHSFVCPSADVILWPTDLHGSRPFLFHSAEWELHHENRSYKLNLVVTREFLWNCIHNPY